MEFSLKLFIYQIVNFAILMVILSIIFNKFIRPFMKKRADDIKSSFDQIEVQKKDIESLKQDYTNQVAQMRQTAKAEIDKAIEEGNKIREEIVAKSEKDAAALVEKARGEIDHERQKALNSIQKEVAQLSMLAARQIIGKQLDEATSKKLVEDFLADLNASQPQR